MRSGVYNIIEQAMLDLPRKDVIEEMIDAQLAKVFDTDAGNEGFSKRLLTSGSFIGPIMPFVWRKTYTAMEKRK